MKGLFLGVILISAMVASLPALALAVSADCIAPPTCANCIPNPLKYKSFECLIEAVINVIFLLSLGIAPLMVLIGAFYLMTAGGNPAKVKTAQSIFIWTAVGLLIILMAKGVSSIIQAFITGNP